MQNISNVTALCFCREINIANLRLPHYGVWLISYNLRFESTHGFSIIAEDVIYLKTSTKILQMYENIIPRISNNKCTICNTFIYTASNDELEISLNLHITISRYDLCCTIKLIDNNSDNQYHLRATRIA